MYLVRFLFRRRNLRRVIWIVCTLFMFISLKMSLTPVVNEESRPLRFVLGQFNKYSGAGTDKTICSIPNVLNGSQHSDTYTYDLPDITEYRLLEKNKEYAIPVKSEKEAAYGPDLEEVKVFIVPFSHVDPGYGNTMEGYYRSKTKGTLNSMVQKLGQYRNLTFQWAETVFLERWWRDITDDVKERVREFIRRGQLEIVLGGWVMPDEASTHYVSVIDQLIEGHQWLIENLGVKPKNSWSNDPFGYSSTMPYLWKQAGMENMVILRIHQAIKGTLMKRKSLEFYWKQYWSNNNDNNILTHIMPYRGYWIGDVCGPYNQHICREYAFMHTEPIHKVVFITKENLAERAQTLYEQYRITADLYQHKALYIGLGEDFSYSQPGDWDRIYQNYEMLINYINSKKEWKMKVKFGTLAEYFDAIRDDEKRQSINKFPVLSGDFFPYSDYRNDYWTGYYTTRPFNKQHSRDIQALIRAADIFHAYAYSYTKHWKVPYVGYRSVTTKLRLARRELGMFLHHDGITGTSVSMVINDFQKRLYEGYKNVKSALKTVALTLLTQGGVAEETFLDDTVYRKSYNTEGEPVAVATTDGKLVIINPTSKERHEIVSFITASGVDIYDSYEINVPVQRTAGNVQTLAASKEPFDKNYFEAKLKPLSISVYKIRPAEVTIPLVQQKTSNDETITIENIYLRAEFSGKTGLLTKLLDKTSNKFTIFFTEILAYNSVRSGAYIFAPEAEPMQFLTDTLIVSVSEGSLVSQVTVVCGRFKQIAKLYHTSGVQSRGLHIEAKLDLQSLRESNKEVIIRMKTDIKNNGLFYTDQNGFQMMGRKNYPDRPVENNYYPVTSMVILEDSMKRLTLHTAQPHGAASYREGWLEVMLDRTVSRDDGKGLGQGVRDSTVTTSLFVIQVESSSIIGKVKEPRYTFPSTTSLLINDALTNPLQLLSASSKLKPSTEFTSFRPVSSDLPCNVFIVGMRNLAKTDLQYNGTSLIMHKRSGQCGFPSVGHNCDHVHEATVNGLFADVNVTSTYETTLSHLYTTTAVKVDDDLSPGEMELRAFKLML